MRTLVTGATGLLGSHVAEKLIARGDRVRALVRPGSSTGFLEELGAEIVVGDLSNSADCLTAVADSEVVFHCAAKVGDWGTRAEFRRDVIQASENLASAACTAKVRRFVHISSTSAYGHPKSPAPIDESAPLGQGLWIWDDYTWSKVETERLLTKLTSDRGLPLTIIRPSWLYGERDRTTLARLIERLRSGIVPLIGPGDNPLSAIYAGAVADAAILAADHPEALGQAYNITDQGPITQAEFLNMMAQAAGAPPVHRALPYRLVFAAALAFEAAGKLMRNPKPPLITRYAAWLMGRRISYSTLKARTQLGWRPDLSYQESIARSVSWYLGAKAHEHSAVAATPSNGTLAAQPIPSARI